MKSLGPLSPGQFIRKELPERSPGFWQQEPVTRVPARRVAKKAFGHRTRGVRRGGFELGFLKMGIEGGVL